MPTSFFNNYRIIPYDLYGDGSITALTNITQEVMVTSSKLPDDASVYTYYTIPDGDRPDTVSYNLYGDVQYYWTFFILNSFLKDGLSSAWPLSYYDFNAMIEKEYSPYSAITFKALAAYDMSLTSAMDFSITPLDSKYLPYLQLKNSNGDSAKILKFDAARQQLVIYDISSSFRDAFIAYPQYNLVWVGPSSADNLKTEWLSIMSLMYTDPNGLKHEYKTTILDPALATVESAISNHTYIPTSVTSSSGAITYPYNWSLYYNAAHTYYDTNGNTSTVYDLLRTNTTEPSYKSFQEIESENNDAKTQIKIIRADKISDFSSAYFSVLTQ